MKDFYMRAFGMIGGLILGYLIGIHGTYNQMCADIESKYQKIIQEEGPDVAPAIIIKDGE